MLRVNGKYYRNICTILVTIYVVYTVYQKRTAKTITKIAFHVSLKLTDKVTCSTIYIECIFCGPHYKRATFHLSFGNLVLEWRINPVSILFWLKSICTFYFYFFFRTALTMWFVFCLSSSFLTNKTISTSWKFH